MVTMWAAFLFGGVCGFCAGALVTALIAIGWIKWQLEAQEHILFGESELDQAVEQSADAQEHVIRQRLRHFDENKFDQAVEPEARIDAWGSPMVVDRRDWPGDQAVER